jgi:hypothetical protein
VAKMPVRGQIRARHVLSAVAAAALAGCRSSSAVGSRGPVDDRVGHSLQVTYQGYRFREWLAAPGFYKRADVTTSDTGTVISTPPGKTLIVAKVVYANDTKRTEPFVFYPSDPTSPGEEFPYTLFYLDMIVPTADASQYGISPTDRQACTSAQHPDGNAYLSGYCDLYAEVSSASPPSGAFRQLPKLAPGASATITLIVDGPNSDGVPQGVSLKAIRLYADACMNSSDKICPALLS